MLNYTIPCSSVDVTADSIVYVIIAIQNCVYLVFTTVRMQPVRTTDRSTSLKTRICLADKQIPCTTWKPKFYILLLHSIAIRPYSYSYPRESNRQSQGLCLYDSFQYFSFL